MFLSSFLQNKSDVLRLNFQQQVVQTPFSFASNLAATSTLKLKHDFFDSYSYTLKKDLLFNPKLKKKLSHFSKPIRYHYQSINALTLNKTSQFLASGGDDKIVAIWDIDKCFLDCTTKYYAAKPYCMNKTHQSNIFALQFTASNSSIISAGNDHIFLIHDLTTGQLIDSILCDSAIYGLSANPLNSNVFVSALQDGLVLLKDLRENTYGVILASYRSTAHSVTYHPVDNNLILSTSSSNGVSLIDIRHPGKILKTIGQFKCGPISACFDQLGKNVLVNSHRQCLVMLKLSNPQDQVIFDDAGFFSISTNKMCCFSGLKDEYVVCGSDDTNVYMWKRPINYEGVSVYSSALSTLSGHLSVVNQVCYSKSHRLLISSGVDTFMRLWAPYHFPSYTENDGQDCGSFFQRNPYVHKHQLIEEYIRLEQEEEQIILEQEREQICFNFKDNQLGYYFDGVLQKEICRKNSFSEYQETSAELDEVNHSLDNLIRSVIHPIWSCTKSEFTDCNKLEKKQVTSSSYDVSEFSENNNDSSTISSIDSEEEDSESSSNSNICSKCGGQGESDHLKSDYLNHLSDCQIQKIKNCLQLLVQYFMAQWHPDKMVSFSNSASIVYRIIDQNHETSLLSANSFSDLICIGKVLHQQGPLPSYKNVAEQFLSLCNAHGTRTFLHIITGPSVAEFPCLRWECNREVVLSIVKQHAFLLYINCERIVRMLTAITTITTNGAETVFSNEELNSIDYSISPSVSSSDSDDET